MTEVNLAIYENTLKQLNDKLQNDKIAQHHILTFLETLYNLLFTLKYYNCNYSDADIQEFVNNLLYFISKDDDNLSFTLYKVYTDDLAVFKALLNKSIEIVKQLIAKQNIESH